MVDLLSVLLQLYFLVGVMTVVLLCVVDACTDRIVFDRPMGYLAELMFKIAAFWPLAWVYAWRHLRSSAR